VLRLARSRRRQGLDPLPDSGGHTAVSVAHSPQVRTSRRRIGAGHLAVLTTLFALAAWILLPKGFEAGALLAAQDDPRALAVLALDKAGFDSVKAEREIEEALASGDSDLAHSFLQLARDRGVAVAPALAARVESSVAAENSVSGTAKNFARGFVSGEPDNLSSLAGTALGDLFVFGDIRDAVREGKRLATGEKVDELVLGLACVGLAITAGTYASLGAGAPARLGVSVVKAARKTGHMSTKMGEWIGRSVRDVVDWSALKRVGTAGFAAPVVAVHAVRDAVKVEKSHALMDLVRNTGRVQSKAGTRAALDGLKLADGPRDLARVAKLAEKNGGKTRAILKLLGRSAILLTVGTFNLASWIFWSILALVGFVSGLKSGVERAVLGHSRRKKNAIARKQARILALQPAAA
jgi:hypothetical protein